MDGKGGADMILSETPRIELLNMDCMEFMAGCKDKQFSLAIVDPPYGIGVNHNMGRRKGDRPSNYKPAFWDNTSPDKVYFETLFRISENQIIWGANHFIDKISINSPCWLMWDKGFSEDLTFAQFELAWSSFDSTCKKYELHPSQQHRIHPTQKPVKLYEWLLTNYAKPGDTILDTHGGSFSSAIAAYRLGFDFVGTEKDFDYYTAAVKRFKEQTAQMSLFKPVAKPEPVQLSWGDKTCPNCNRHHSEAGEFCCTACEFGI
jgi:site-specific DNA-methyltransferase (adenine-specific)